MLDLIDKLPFISKNELARATTTLSAYGYNVDAYGSLWRNIARALNPVRKDRDMIRATVCKAAEHGDVIALRIVVYQYSDFYEPWQTGPVEKPFRVIFSDEATKATIETIRHIQAYESPISSKSHQRGSSKVQFLVGNS